MAYGSMAGGDTEIQLRFKAETKEALKDSKNVEAALKNIEAATKALGKTATESDKQMGKLAKELSTALGEQVKSIKAEESALKNMGNTELGLYSEKLKMLERIKRASEIIIRLEKQKQDEIRKTNSLMNDSRSFLKGYDDYARKLGIAEVNRAHRQALPYNTSGPGVGTVAYGKMVNTAWNDNSDFDRGLSSSRTFMSDYDKLAGKLSRAEVDRAHSEALKDKIAGEKAWDKWYDDNAKKREAQQKDLRQVSQRNIALNNAQFRQSERDKSANDRKIERDKRTKERQADRDLKKRERDIERNRMKGEHANFIKDLVKGNAGLQSLSAIRNAVLLSSFAIGGAGMMIGGMVSASMERERAMQGLSSIGGKLNIGKDSMSSAVNQISGGGMISITDTSAGLKNLLSTGIGLPKALELMNAFKQAAAFNRQGTLEWGQAIVGATDGFKNMNSRMTDNAGITKNLSVILKEQAALQGRRVADLSELEKSQLIANGLIKEAALFAGDAEKAMGTLSGQWDRAAAQTKILAANLSDASGLTSAVQGLASAWANASEKMNKYYENQGNKDKKTRQETLDGKRRQVSFGSDSWLVSMLQNISMVPIPNQTQGANLIDSLNANLGDLQGNAALTKAVQKIGRMQEQFSKLDKMLASSRVLQGDDVDLNQKIFNFRQSRGNQRDHLLNENNIDMSEPKGSFIKQFDAATETEVKRMMGDAAGASRKTAEAEVKRQLNAYESIYWNIMGMGDRAEPDKYDKRYAQVNTLYDRLTQSISEDVKDPTKQKELSALLEAALIKSYDGIEAGRVADAAKEKAIEIAKATREAMAGARGRLKYLGDQQGASTSTRLGAAGAVHAEKIGNIEDLFYDSTQQQWDQAMGLEQGRYKKEIADIKNDPYKRAAEGINEVGSSFRLMSRAAQQAGASATGALVKTLDKSMQAAAGLSQVAQGLGTISTGGGNPFSTFVGGVQAFSGLVNLGVGLFGDTEEEKAKKEKRKAKNFGTTIQRGPTTYNIYPSLSVDSGGGDVYFGVDGPEVLKENIQQMIQESFDDNSLVGA